jgi:hypothetical protein
MNPCDKDGYLGDMILMAQPHRNEKQEAFYRRRILPWEDKRSYDPYLVWDGSFRWFRSANIVPLEQYRTVEEINRIRANVLRRHLRLVGL